MKESVSTSMKTFFFIELIAAFDRERTARNSSRGSKTAPTAYVPYVEGSAEGPQQSFGRCSRETSCHSLDFSYSSGQKPL